MRRLAVAAAAVSWLAVVPAAPAHAAVEWRTFTVLNRYVPGDLSITAGDKLTLVNLENAPHDIWSDQLGSNGKPLFHANEVIGAGGTAPVTGVSSLEPGAYGYYCSVHTEMRGLITVA